jgi:hypothetical protein
MIMELKEMKWEKLDLLKAWKHNSYTLRQIYTQVTNNTVSTSVLLFYTFGSGILSASANHRYQGIEKLLALLCN